LARVAYFSDVLCIWAYLAQIKVDEMRKQFGSKVEIDCHFIAVFGNTAEKIGAGWEARGGFTAYNRHALSVAAGFPHVHVHSEVWLKTKPASSVSCHLFVKAVRGLCAQHEIAAASPDSGRPIDEELAWRLRLAFFSELRDISQRAVQLEIAEELRLPVDRIVAQIDSGRAFADLWSDSELQKRHLVDGSPTWVLNDGRQKLYGNVGYRIIEANLKEILARPDAVASWC
jgi:predicted DsbA family dithiol-disulfide isomerase